MVGVKRDPQSRGGSSFMHEQLRVGTALKISAPRNNFPLKEDAPTTLLFAGGIGITPIYCMSQKLAALGRKWHMYYSSRSRTDAAFLDELSSFDCVTFNFDDENHGKFLDLKGILGSAPKDSHAYCCGPLPMLRAFEEAAGAALPADQVHVEYFTAAVEAATEGGYVLDLARSKREFVVPPGKTILAVVGHRLPERAGAGAWILRALAEAGVNVEMLSYGQGSINLTMVIDDAEVDRAVRALHGTLLVG